MKATLSFNLPEEQGEFQAAVDAGKYRAALWEISQRVFRPARKHGYADIRVQSLLDTTDSVKVPSMDGYTEDLVGGGTELVAQLERIFYEILREEGIEL
jgi:hypothetical protein